jgi:hypothetical protein
LTREGLLVLETDPAAAFVVNPLNWDYATARQYGYPGPWLRADVASYEMNTALDEEKAAWERGYLNGLRRVQAAAQAVRRRQRREERRLVAACRRLLRLSPA